MGIANKLVLPIIWLLYSLTLTGKVSKIVKQNQNSQNFKWDSLLGWTPCLSSLQSISTTPGALSACRKKKFINILKTILCYKVSTLVLDHALIHRTKIMKSSRQFSLRRRGTQKERNRVVVDSPVELGPKSTHDHWFSCLLVVLSEPEQQNQDKNLPEELSTLATSRKIVKM